MSYVHLSVHSQFSILNSTASVKALAKRAKKLGMESLAVTDTCNMYGAVDFYKACKAEGVKPIIGIEITVSPGHRTEKTKVRGRSGGYPILLYAMNETGYRNLCKLSSIAFTEGFYYTPRIDKEVLEQYHEGLICLSGSLRGPITTELLEGKSEELAWYHALFGDRFYLQIERMQMADGDIVADKVDQESWLYALYTETIERQERVNQLLIAEAKKRSIPLVATNTVHYVEREDWLAHEILLNVQSGEPREIWERDAYGNPKGRMLNPKRSVYASHEHYFKSVEQMEMLFADLPEALAETKTIAERCTFKIDFNARHYPVYTPEKPLGLPTHEEEVSACLKNFCEEGIARRYTPETLAKVQEKYPGRDPMDVVRERIDYELETIISKGMCDYLLIVYDFIAWAKGQGIPVGPGRGSGAGSIILYLIGITDMEPLSFGLFFERFINPERPSYPDIDVDICMERRSEVIEYTLQKYGQDRVAQIITFGTMKAKMAIKDVGRVLSVPLAKVNEIAKLVPEDPNMTLKKALEIDPDLSNMYENDEDAKRIIDLGKKVEGSIRNTGIHAAGLIICGEPLTDHIPICTAKDTHILATQYAMKPVEAVGMLKIDFLGLKTLTTIQKTIASVEKKTGKTIDLESLSLSDQTTFDLLNQGKTLGVFQLESSGMQELIKQLHIDKFEEIRAVGALYRPGPMEMIPSFINRKHGREKIEMDHPELAEILEETYGIMVYQEQVMQIAQNLAGYSLGEGDLLRKAMGKKDRDEMMRQKEKFKEGAVQHGLTEELAVTIFDKVEKFASYGFNKSHATAYGFLSYVTAYLKANYTGEWLAALMTCDMDDITKVSKHIREATALGHEILPPDVNEAGIEFVSTESGIRFAMSGIKGVGRGVVEAILEEREKGGSFANLYDFFERVDGKKVGKKAVESLVEAGCFDFTGWTREQMLHCVGPMYDAAAQKQKEEKSGIMDLFAAIDAGPTHHFDKPPEIANGAPIDTILRREKELLGFYLTGHPMEEHEKTITDLGCMSFAEVCELADGAPARVAFIIEAVTTRISKAQKKFAILNISDGHEQRELPIWPDLFEANSGLLRENQLVYAILQVDKETDDVKLRCRWLADLCDLDDEVKQLAEEAYERAKSMGKKKKSAPKETPEHRKREMAEKKLKLFLELKAKEVRLSHILELKKIFQDNSGHITVDVAFIGEQGVVGKVAINPDWGVRFDHEVEMLLRRLKYVEKVELRSL